jgi:hypothetical protein
MKKPIPVILPFLRIRRPVRKASKTAIKTLLFVRADDRPKGA